MKYYVIWPNGQRFGPADLMMLRQWLQENRIDANTVLEEERSGQKVTAGNVLGLGLGSPPGPSATQSSMGPTGQMTPPPTAPYPGDPAPHDPFQSQPYMGYYRPAQQGSMYGADPRVVRDGKTELTASWVLGGLGLLTVCCSNVILPLVGLGLGISAKSKGHPSAVAAITFNAIVLLMHVGILVFGLLANSVN